MTEFDRELDRVLTRLASLPERHRHAAADLTHRASQHMRDLTSDTTAPELVPRVGDHAAAAQLKVLCAELRAHAGDETEAAQVLADLRRALP